MRTYLLNVVVSLFLLSGCGLDTLPPSLNDMSEVSSDMSKPLDCEGESAKILQKFITNYPSAKMVGCKANESWPPSVPWYLQSVITCTRTLPELKTAVYVTLIDPAHQTEVWYKDGNLQGFDEKGNTCSQVHEDQSIKDRSKDSDCNEVRKLYCLY